MHWLLFHFWRGLASLASVLYARRHEPALWLMGLIILELVAFWVIWGPLLRVL